jgi:ribosomal 30S subunit maturation factor RimM
LVILLYLKQTHIFFDVNDSHEKKYGFVIDIIKLPTNDSILFNYNNEDIIIPIIDDFIELFDFKNRILIIKNFEGFLTK